MKIGLATVHSSPMFTPLALLYLKAYLVAQRTLAAGSVNPGIHPERFARGDRARRVLEGEPAIVGLSCYVWNITTLMAASRLIKRLRPDVRIVLGGPEVGPVARSVLEHNPSVDCIVKSEGELAFNAIVDTWKGGGDIAAVKGICFGREHDVIETEDAEFLRDLDELASPLQILEIEFDPEPPYHIRSHYSMTPADMAYGLKVVDAVGSVGRSWTIRLLGREAGVTFADVIDAWIDWADVKPAESTVRLRPQDDKERIRRFIRHFCALKRIPPAFYEASWTIEFGATIHAATATAVASRS